MIVFLRSSDIGIDSKLQRYSKALRNCGVEHCSIFWDRNGCALGNDAIPAIKYSRPEGHKNRFVMALKLMGLNCFALRKMWGMRHKIRLVHAIDFDTAVAAWLFNLITNIPYIYDIYDSYPDSRGITGLSRKLIDGFEKAIIARASLVILADECRREQHCPIPPMKTMIIENVPDLKQSKILADPTSGKESSCLRIGYLGTLEPRFRGLEDMLSVVQSMPQVELHIAGSGALEHHVRDCATRCSNIHYHGPMEHWQGLSLLSKCDVLMGLYYADVPNHRFAAPNKYYEHLLLGRPLLTSTGTPPGTKVSRDKTGWVIDDGAEAIQRAIEEMQSRPAVIRQKGTKAATFWTDRYAGYFEQTVSGSYALAVMKLSKLSGRQPSGSLRHSPLLGEAN